MGVHESQSLFCEMQLGANPAFHVSCSLKIAQHLNCHFSAQELAQHYTRVNPGLIRVDADEVTYPATFYCGLRQKKPLSTAA